MTAQILNGRALARSLRAELGQRVAEFARQSGIAPALAVVRVGQDFASVSYARAIQAESERLGIGFAAHELPPTASMKQLLDLLVQLGADAQVHGIMLQEPLPKGWDGAAAKMAIPPLKDIDGVHPLNAGRLALSGPVGRAMEAQPYFVPATPAGGLELLKRHGVVLQGRQAVVLGRSNIVGKPMAWLLLRENATVTLGHSHTADLPALCRQADVLCVAIGRARMVQGDWIKPGAAVIDFGVNEIDGQMCGDVDFDRAVQTAGMITPVPGGTGPVTNVMLMQNVLQAAIWQMAVKDVLS